MTITDLHVYIRMPSDPPERFSCLINQAATTVQHCHNIYFENSQLGQVSTSGSADI